MVRADEGDAPGVAQWSAQACQPGLPFTAGGGEPGWAHRWFGGERLSEEDRAEYARLADRLDETRSNVLTIAGVRQGVTRVERLIRIGPDGPEGPRPSDYDPEPPIDVQTRRLKEQGLWKDEDDDADIELDERTQELKRLWDAEWERMQERRGKRGR